MVVQVGRVVGGELVLDRTSVCCSGTVLHVFFIGTSMSEELLHVTTRILSWYSFARGLICVNTYFPVLSSGQCISIQVWVCGFIVYSSPHYSQ